MRERANGLYGPGQPGWFAVLVTTLCVTITALLSACDSGPGPADTPELRASASPTPATADRAIPVVSNELRSDKNRAAPTAGSGDVAALVDGNGAFAFDLYQALRGQQGNLFYSPHSISLALAMTYAGAGGQTASQMADTLRFSLTQDQLHPAFNALDHELASRGTDAQGRDGEGFRLNIVNAVWGQQGHPFQEAFLDVLAESYGAGVRPTDFIAAPEESRDSDQ